jgi:hypothetical protein
LVGRSLHLNRDPELQTSSDDSSSDNDIGAMENDTDEANSGYSDDYSSDNLFDVSSSFFEGVRVFDCINPSLYKSYFSVGINGEKSIHTSKHQLGLFRRIRLLCLQIV